MLLRQADSPGGPALYPVNLSPQTSNKLRAAAADVQEHALAVGEGKRSVEEVAEVRQLRFTPSGEHFKRQSTAELDLLQEVRRICRFAQHGGSHDGDLLRA